MKVEVLDEYRQKIINDGEDTITVYDLRGTPEEKPIILNPGDEAVIYIKKPPEKKSKKKSEKSENREEVDINISA